MSSMRAQGVKAAAVVLSATLAMAGGAGSFTTEAPQAAALVPAPPVTFAEGADMIPVDAMELEPEGGG